MLAIPHSVDRRAANIPYGQLAKKAENTRPVPARGLPVASAHTAVCGPGGTLGVVVVPGLQVRTWNPLALPFRPASRAREKNLFDPSEVTYLISTFAPASSNFFLMAAASSLFTPSLTAFGAPSTRSFASFKPRLVTSRTALMTLILFAPTSVSTTVNSVLSSGGGGGVTPPPVAPPATTAAAAETPKVSSIFFTRSAASRSVKPLIPSRIVSTLFAIAVSSPPQGANLKSYGVASGPVPIASGLSPPELNLLALTASLTVTARLRGNAASAEAMRCAGARSKNMILPMSSSFEGSCESCWICSIERTRPSTIPARNLNAGTSLAIFVSALASATGSLQV